MRLLDEEEAAVILGVSAGRVRVLARSGELAGHWMGATPRFHLSTLERFRDDNGGRADGRNDNGGYVLTAHRAKSRGGHQE